MFDACESGLGAAGVAEAPAAAACGRAVLIVDDEPELARLMAEIIAGLAERIDLAEDGAAALGLAERRRYDLIISDVRMPRLDGPGLLDRLRQSGFAGRFLFVTGDCRGSAGRLGAGVPFIEKPFLPSEVRRRVAEAVGGP